MSKEKREKFAATVTQEKYYQKKPFMQVEGKLTEAQLEAIMGGVSSGECPVDRCTANHNETMVSSAQLNLEGDTHV